MMKNWLIILVFFSGALYSENNSSSQKLLKPQVLSATEENAKEYQKVQSKPVPSKNISSSPLKIKNLKERLKKAQKGDYIIAKANKMTVLLAIRFFNETTIILEEITAPDHQLKKQPDSWPEWIQKRAPGHTSWSMVEIDMKTGQVLECYSFSRGAWIQTSNKESLFASLLNLPLKKVEEKERRRVGPPPLEGEEDRRKIWEPNLIFEGKKINSPKFEVFEATWPQDETEISGKKVSMFFDQNFFFPLPFWIQVDSSHASAIFRVIDSGKKLPSFYKSLPRRVPEFIGSPEKTKTGLKLSLKSPKYYRSFDLFAIDVTKKEKQIFPINYSLTSKNEEILTLEIEQEHLLKTLEKDHQYKWLIVPTDHLEFYAETARPYLWTEEN